MVNTTASSTTSGDQAPARSRVRTTACLDRAPHHAQTTKRSPRVATASRVSRSGRNHRGAVPPPNDATACESATSTLWASAAKAEVQFTTCPEKIQPGSTSGTRYTAAAGCWPAPRRRSGAAACAGSPGARRRSRRERRGGRGDHPGQRAALDQPHHVERRAVGIGAQSVDQHDAGVLEHPRDAALAQEALARLSVAGPRRADALERHVACEHHLAQPAARDGRLDREALLHEHTLDRYRRGSAPAHGTHGGIGSLVVHGQAREPRDRASKAMPRSPGKQKAASCEAGFPVRACSRGAFALFRSARPFACRRFRSFSAFFRERSVWSEPETRPDRLR